MQTPLLTESPQTTPWTNLHHTVTVVPQALYTVWNLWLDEPAPTAHPWRAGLAGLQALVAEAERTQRHIRAYGGAWSLSEVATTRDIMVNTKPLNYVELGFRPTSVDPAFDGDPSALCFAQCGLSVMELYDYLEARGFTLPTSGASNGQTMGGAISTGTHGSANGVGAMQDYILGMHLVADQGKSYWIERASKPVVSPSFCAALGAELRRDDELFHSALVSFGCFGLVHAYVFEAAPIYLLEKNVSRYDYDRVRDSLSTLNVGDLGLGDDGALPFHYEVIIDPHRLAPGKLGAYVRWMQWRPCQSVLPRAQTTSRLVQGDDAMSVAGLLSDAAPSVVPALLEQVLNASFRPARGELGTPGSHFGPTDVRGRVMSSEIGVALADAERALDAIVSVAHAFPWAGFPAFRFVKGSRATVAFTGFHPISCAIELPSAGSDRSAEAFERVWAEFENRGIPFTLHWGQQMPSRLEFFERAYGDRLTRWLTQRHQILGTSGQRVFRNEWFERCGFG